MRICYFLFYNSKTSSNPIPKRNVTDNKPVNEIINNNSVNDTVDITTVGKWDVSKVNIKIKEGTLTSYEFDNVKDEDIVIK